MRFANEVRLSSENFAYLRCADDFAQIYIHPCVAADQVTIVRFAVLQFDQLERKKKLQRKIYNHGTCSKCRYADGERLYVPLDGFGPFSIATAVTEIEKNDEYIENYSIIAMN